ncbi:MAG TPA: LLM class flavin-dependent oxidoreductase [Alcanivoracaceae bacterium]|nr:LLM class flavin-dependent oxidoreductase [Alcanivoracaceae bacterium]
MLQDIAFSVLDLAPVTDQGTEAEAIAHSVTLAQQAEQLGYKRFWLAEHHNMDGIASAATAVLIGHIAGATKHIRVGAGGVMLPNHAPLVVAENFGTLATIYPNRIDLGLGRAPGGDQLTLRALRRHSQENVNEFPEQVALLEQLFGPEQPEQRLFARPGTNTQVPIWLLGSSLFSAQLAAMRGLPYSFASHFAPAMLHQALQIYRENFQPSEHLDKPHVMVAAPLLAADTDEEASFLATTSLQRTLSLIRGGRLRMQPPIEDMEPLWNPRERQAVLAMHGKALIGGPDKVKRELEALVASTQADEVIFTCDFYDFEHRVRALKIAASFKA